MRPTGTGKEDMPGSVRRSLGLKLEAHSPATGSSLTYLGSGLRTTVDRPQTVLLLLHFLKTDVNAPQHGPKFIR